MHEYLKIFRKYDQKWKQLMERSCLNVITCHKKTLWSNLSLLSCFSFDLNPFANSFLLKCRRNKIWIKLAIYFISQPASASISNKLFDDLLPFWYSLFCLLGRSRQDFFKFYKRTGRSQYGEWRILLTELELY